MTYEQAQGAIIIVSGPSGVGKSTVCQLLDKIRGNLHFSVSCTTRPRRPNEIDGMAYHFLDEEQYDRHLKAGEFLEHATVHGNLYGTLLSELEPVKKRQDVLLDIDVQGMRQVREALATRPFWSNRLVTVFLMPPSHAELERRLRGRGTDSDEVIRHRLANAEREMAAWHEYDYVLVNEDSKDTAKALDAIITAAHYRSTILTQEVWNG